MPLKSFHYAFKTFQPSITFVQMRENKDQKTLYKDNFHAVYSPQNVL